MYLAIKIVGNFLYLIFKEKLLVCHEQVFRPDRLNAFEVQTEADAMLERQRRDILPGLTTPKTPGEKRLVTHIFTGVRIRGCNLNDAVIGHSEL